MKKKMQDTTITIKTWVLRTVTLLVAISIALVGMSLLKFISLPDVVTKFVGYLLIVAAVFYLYRKLK